MSYPTTILADTPQAYYRLDEASGLVAHDSTSHHYDAALSGVMAYSQPGAILTNTDTSIAFAASGAVSLPYTLNDTTFSAISLEFWINLGTGGWQYIVATNDGATTLLYLNALVVAAVASSSIQVSALFDVAGSSGSATLDEIALYDYALSAVQILNHYAVAGYSAVVLLGALARRSGILPALARRSGSGTSGVRRDGVKSLSRRSGTGAVQVRRDGVTPGTKRRG